MQKFKSSLLVVVLAAVCLPQTATKLVTPEIRRVGDRLACKCGVCNNTVATCQMLECHYTSPAREKIGEMQKAGMSDQQIVETFVKERGVAALSAPPTEGFHLLGYMMPFIVILLGMGAIFVYWKRFKKPATLPALADTEPQLNERYRKRIEQELADLD